MAKNIQKIPKIDQKQYKIAQNMTQNKGQNGVNATKWSKIAPNSLKIAQNDQNSPKITLINQIYPQWGCFRQFCTL